MKRERPDLDQAVQVCEHMAQEGEPALWGRRMPPEDAGDSGRQFRCSGDKVESPARFERWPVEELITVDSSILEILGCPNGARVERSGPEEQWTVTGFDPRKPVR